MCGRYTDTKRDKQFLVRMGVANVEQAEIDFVPRYNLAPTQTASVVMWRENGPELRQARWGLIPSWAKDEKIGNSLINARGDTVASKPAFRRSFKKKRCLVLADGFFEWKKVPGGKQPIYIRLRGGTPFVFAGLWDSWNELESFTIITTEPNTVCAKVHDRMPVILEEKDFARWLDPKAAVEEVSSLIRSFADGEMEAFPVSPIVNSPKLDAPRCVERVQVVEQTSFAF
ncbi:MAG TPA: SOS response-associated peptidase [Verrucomicrobiae bacterium]